MTATEELRRMLDERGVKYDTAATVISETVATFWCDRDGEPCTALEGSDDIPDGKLSVQALLTPAQAIDATLGRGECHIAVQDNLAETDGMGDVWLECDACNWQMPLEPSTPRFNYCPNCGAEVVDE